MPEEGLEPQDRERRRLARELHDETLQGLGGVRMLLSTARLHGDPEALRAVVDQALEMLTEEIAKLRQLLVDLRPAELDDIGLEAAIHKLTGRVAAFGGPRVSADVTLAYEMGESPHRLAPELETAAYRIVQEALTNAVKHAQADSVEIRVVDAAGRLEVEVRDNGHGFNGNAGVGHFGITGMKERAALVSGDLEITSSEQGTVVRLAAPAQRSA